MQIGLYDGNKEFVNNKPIRLIELFGGIGCQAKALENLNVKFEHYRMCDFDKYAVQSYNAVHGTNFAPSDITKITADDLGIVETDKYDYIMTYSFPCTDLSKAGQQKGMARGSGTRSGLLWEVERLLDECEELPQVLLMENVPDVIGTKNIMYFSEWIKKLESLGYKNYWKDLNAKDFGIPQNRNRTFMVSLLGDYYYNFPQPTKLELRLKDMLEENVDEKYYLSDKALKGALTTKFCCSKLENKLPKDGIIHTICARDYKDPKCIVEIDEPIACELRCDEGIRTFKDNIMGTLRTIDGCGDKHIIEPTLKEQLCDKLIESGLLKEEMVINSYTNGLNGKNPNSRQTLEDYIESTNGIMPTLTTRPDCLGVVVNEKYLKTKNKRLKSMLNKIDVSKTQAIDMYNQTVSNEINTIKTTVDSSNMTAITQNYRIRKLTPKECWRLMGLSDTDFDKAKASGVSNSQLYKQAGNGIVVNVLMAIFKNLNLKGETE